MPADRDNPRSTGCLVPADPQRHMLQTELELLRHELTLATGRGQLKPLPLGAGAATPLLNLVAQLAQGGAALRRDWQGLDPADRQTQPRRNDPRIGLLRAELALLHQALSLPQRPYMLELLLGMAMFVVKCLHSGFSNASARALSSWIGDLSTSAGTCQPP